MKRELTYIDIDGHRISLVHLDPEERRIVQSLKRQAARNPDWDAFDNYWPQQVLSLYDARGMDRNIQTQTALFQIAVDLSLRLGIASGQIASKTYLADFQKIIREQFENVKRSLCKATGLSETMLSHFLAGRKDISLKKLAAALNKIGYSLRILPHATINVAAIAGSDAASTSKLPAGKKAEKKVG